MMEGKASLSLEDRIFAMHLYIVLQHAMGLKSAIEEGFAHFGTRAMAVELIPLISLHVEKKKCTALEKSFPIMC